MTSRERIKAALNHKQPDRVPVDFGSTLVSGIHVDTVYRLRQALKLGATDEPVKVIEPFQMLGEIKEDLMEKLHADCYPVISPGNRFGIPNSDWKEWTTFGGAKAFVPGKFNTTPSASGEIYMYPEADLSCPPSARMPKGGFYFDTIVRQKPIDESNLDPADNMEDFTPISEVMLEVQKEHVESLHENTDYAIVYSMPGTSLGNIAMVPAPWLKSPKGIRDLEEWYISHVIRKDYIYEVYRCQTDLAIENLRKVRDAFQNRIDIIYISGTDFGSQRGPIFSPDMFKEVYKPHYKRMNDWIHAHTSWKTFIHTCGSVRLLIDDIIEAGFDILNPLQFSAADMDPSELKKTYGNRVTFHGGGVDTQHTLPHGKPEDVYDEVKERIRILNDGGGYIFNTIHNIQADAPIENIKAMVKAIEDSFI